MIIVSGVDASSINAFKSRLIYISDSWMGFFMDLSAKPQALLVG